MNMLERLAKIGLVVAGLAFALAGPGIGVVKAVGANPYPFGKSTYWAWQNRPDLPANLGEAMNWGSNSAAQGWPVGPYPRTGDIAVFAPGMLGAGAGGRVAVVRQVFDDGSYSATQMDDSDCTGTGGNCGRVNSRQYPAGASTRFIHYVKDSRTTWGFAGGAAGWTPINLGAGASEGPGWRYPLAGGDPQLISPDLDIPLDGYNTIQVEMSTSANVVATGMQVLFATDGRPQFSEARSAQVGTKSDGMTHIYVLYFGRHPDWKGRLTRLSLHPAGAGKQGSVRVERVRLIEADPVTQVILRGLQLAY
jgi:surface antigen